MASDELHAIGQELGRVRLQRGDRLEDIAQYTRIRVKQLEAIEAGEPDPTLTDMQLRGLLRNYATYLQLDFDAMHQAYQEALTQTPKGRFGVRLSFTRPEDEDVEVPIIPITANPTTKTPPYGTPRVVERVRQSQEMLRVEANQPSREWVRLAGAMVAGMVLMAGVALVAFLLLSGGDDSPPALNVQSDTDSTDNMNDDIDAEMMDSSPVPTVADDGIEGNDFPKGDNSTPTPMSTTPTQAASGIIVAPDSQGPNMIGADSVVISLSANQRSWVRVVVDTVVEYEGLLRPGTALQYQGNESIIVRTSNAAGIDLVVNNQEMGVLGGRGELYEETFSLSGVSEPVDLSTPTPSESEEEVDPLAPIDESAPPPLLPEDDAPKPLGVPAGVDPPTPEPKKATVKP